MKRILFIIMVMFLSSCGFKPLYEDNQASFGKVLISKDIFVDVIANREGQILRNLLKQQVSSSDYANAEYILNVELSISTTDLGINIDNVATRKRLWVSSKFYLKDMNGNIILNGSSANNVSYAVNDNEFITMTTKQAEIEKSLDILAQDISFKIASFYNK